MGAFVGVLHWNVGCTAPERDTCGRMVGVGPFVVVSAPGPGTAPGGMRMRGEPGGKEVGTVHSKVGSMMPGGSPFALACKDGDGSSVEAAGGAASSRAATCGGSVHLLAPGAHSVHNLRMHHLSRLGIRFVVDSERADLDLDGRPADVQVPRGRSGRGVPGQPEIDRSMNYGGRIGGDHDRRAPAGPEARA